MTARHVIRNKLPAISTGARSGLYRSFWIVTPVARTNLAANPSLETNSTGWAGYGGSISVQRLAGGALLGVGSLKMVTSRGAYGAYCNVAAAGESVGYNGVALVSGTTYAVALDFFAYDGLGHTFSLQVQSAANAVLARTDFKATGVWQRPTLYYTETASATRRIHLVDQIGGADFVVDGLQVEAVASGEQASTYLDGDQQSAAPYRAPPGYGWNGTPHASTSYRLGDERSGGMMRPLSYYGFTLLSAVGLGMSAVKPIATPHGELPGAQYQRTSIEEREFRLNGRFDGRTPQELNRRRGRLYADISRDAVGLDQPLTILYQETEPDTGAPLSDVYRLASVYSGGLDGSYENEWSEVAAPQFTMFLPGIQRDLETGAALNTQATVANANRIIQRSSAGVWSAMGTGATTGSFVYSIVRGRDGSIYAGGDFTSMGGVANTNSIARWDPTTLTWNAVGTGATTGNAVYAMAVAPNGDLYVGGNFTQMGGVANTTRLAKWDGSVWTPLSTGVGASVFALAFGNDGSLYVGGAFDNAGGVAAADRIAKWDGSAFTALGTGTTTGNVLSIVIGLDSNVYVGGDFTSMGGVADTARIAKWSVSGAAWSALSTGMNGAVNALAVAQNGLLYATGAFTTAGGITITRIASWNGSSWQALSTGLGGTGFSLAVGPAGLLYVGLASASAGPVTLPDSLATWNGSAWDMVGVDLPGTATVTAILAPADGSLYLGYDQTGSATAASTTTITNDGKLAAFPTFIINGPTSGSPARLWEIKNTTANVSLFFNLSLVVGEVATLVLEPDNISFSSNFRGELLSSILPGSSSGHFTLSPGSNTITMLSASSSTVAAMRWRNRYDSISQTTR